VRRKLFDMTSNTCDFLKLTKFLVKLTNMTKQIQNISIVVIQVTKTNFPTIATSKKVPPNDSNNERQPEITIWPLKPEILISLEL